MNEAEKTVEEEVVMPETTPKTASIIVDTPFVMVILDEGRTVPLATGHYWMPPMNNLDIEAARVLLRTALKQLDQAEQDNRR